MRFALPALLLLSVAACEPELKHYPPPGECQQEDGGPSCVQNPAGGGTAAAGTGGGTTTSAGGTGGAVPTGDFTGTVHRIVSPAFDDAAMVQYTGAATIVAPGANGNVSAMYGGTVGTTFTLTGAATGNVWILVQDGTNGGGGILSTFVPATLPSTGPLALPVVDLGLLQNIANNLPTVSGIGVSQLAAQVVLQLFHNNAPFKGLKVTSGANGAQIAYDTGPGLYSDSATATGSAGTVILFNAPFNGAHAITFTDTATSTTYDVTIQAGTGAATLAIVEL
jgi:hypothetical protein